MSASGVSSVFEPLERAAQGLMPTPNLNAVHVGRPSTGGLKGWIRCANPGGLFNGCRVDRTMPNPVFLGEVCKPGLGFLDGHWVAINIPPTPNTPRGTR